MVLLNVDRVSVRFGGVVALDDLSFSVEAGQICALIGPNGAGKTTLFNVISRLYQPDEGAVALNGGNLLRVPSHRIVRHGVARTFQNVALFPGLTVLENVLTGAHVRPRRGPYTWITALLFAGLGVPAALAISEFAAVQSTMWVELLLHVLAFLVLPFGLLLTWLGFAQPMLRMGTGREEHEMRREGLALLDRLSLAHLAHRPVAGLPFGTLKRIELARALASRPQLLLLDEPANGLTHSEVDELVETLRQIRDDFDLTILLVEHHMAMVMSLSEHIVVLDFGKKIAEGTPDQVRNDPKVIEAYLGTPT